MIVELLTTYRYQTEFIMMFGGMGILFLAIWLDGKLRGDRWYIDVLAAIGSSIAFIGFVLCLISIWVNGA